MSFLSSPFVKRSYDEAEFLRQRVVELTSIMQDGREHDEQIALEYLHALYGLVECEHRLHTRLRLSNDAEALIAASKLDGAQIAADTDGYTNGDEFYRQLKKDIMKAIYTIDTNEYDDPLM
jgi:hypothetical protein